uniref:Peptidase S1 domain-containing protein n=1 Tax=Plectus sambesii TaxID=2011161 RepID=A0A914W906_9BILA
MRQNDRSSDRQWPDDDPLAVQSASTGLQIILTPGRARIYRDQTDAVMRLSAQGRPAPKLFTAPAIERSRPLAIQIPAQVVYGSAASVAVEDDRPSLGAEIPQIYARLRDWLGEGDFGFYYPGKEERSRRRSLHCAIVVLVVIVIALVVLNALVPFLIRRNVTTVNEHVPSTAPLPYISGTSDNQGPSSQVEKIILITGRPFQISRHKMPVDRSRTSELVVAESSTTTALPTSTELAATASAPPATTESSTTLNAASPTATTILATTTSPAVSTWLPVFDPDVVCNPDQFKCSSGVSRIPCLYNWERCDGIADCSDGSDERFCDKLHCYGNFECDNGDCVALDKVCNGIPDCNDGSDETKCAAFQCQAYEYRCPSGYCIPKEWICDGEQDCGDHREEYNCSDSCAPNQFLCQEGWCISDAWRCNGVADCAGGEDEADCACSVDQIRCHTGQCLHESKQCNGISDCPDHSDEWGCERLRPDGLTEVHNGNATGVLCFDNFADQTAQFVCQRFGRGLPQAKTAVLTGESLVRLQLSDKSGGGGQISDCESDHALAVDCDGSTCGVWHPTKSSSSRAKRVVGGHVSGQHQWPSLALLYHPRNKGACTASIISSVWLLTSALCVRRIDADPGDWRVIAGNAQPNETDTTTMTRMIAEFITHPNYKFRTMVASNDVMLVRLQKELPLNKARLNGLLGAICLPPRETDDQNTFCVTAGWGYTNPGGYYINKQLRHLEMSVWKSAECNSSDHYSGLIDPTILCASSKEQEWGPCFNDEGSPLMCHDAVSGRWYLAGILTTHRCGSRNHPAIFADIFAVKEWISHLVFRSAQRLHETTE